MCVNHLPPLVEVVGDNIPFICDGTGGTYISGVVRPPISQPAMTHGYFMWSQNKRQDIAAKAIAGQKCQSDTPRPKPNTGTSCKAKKQMKAALDGGQSVPSQKKSGRGWTNKPKCKMVLHPQMTEMHPPTSSLVEDQRNPRFRLVGACHSIQQCCVRRSWMTLTLGQY